MAEQIYDVLIIGAGPAGLTCAIKLAESGLHIAIIDQSSFPKDKTCGDGLSLDSINQLPMISTTLNESFERFEHKMPSYGIKVTSDKGDVFTIPHYYKGVKKCGYVCKRIDFDKLLFEELKRHSHIQFIPDCKVLDAKVTDNFAEITTTKGMMNAKIIVGSDGANSVIARKLHNRKLDKDSSIIGLRRYYKEVYGFHEDHYIEMYFFKELLPGYLWIFPLPNNQANVGLGMISSIASKKKINLKETLENLLKTHPVLKDRFQNAQPLETVKGALLPVAMKKQKISGTRYILTGDAAGLTDPLSGEGIANAMRSGRVAAEHLSNCFRHDNFTETFNEQYDKEIYRRMWNEFRVSKLFLRVFHSPRLLNFLINKISKKPELQTFIIECVANPNQLKKLISIRFIWKILC